MTPRPDYSDTPESWEQIALEDAEIDREIEALGRVVLMLLVGAAAVVVASLVWWL